MLKKAVDFFVFSNLYVALPILFLIAESELVFQHPIPFYYYLFIYTSTLLTYNLHRIVGIATIPSVDVSARHQWAIENKWWLYFLIFSCFIIDGWLLLFYLSKMELLICATTGLITLGYSFPFIKTRKTKLKLRDLPFLKLILIAVVVSIVTLLPLIEKQIDFRLILFFIARIFFIAAITIPFDIRDVVFDKKMNLKTLPTTFGIKNAKIFAILFLLLSQINLMELGLQWQFLFLVSNIIAALILLKTTPHRHDFYFSFLVEGTMILQFVVLLF